MEQRESTAGGVVRAQRANRFPPEAVSEEGYPPAAGGRARALAGPARRAIQFAFEFARILFAGGESRLRRRR
jgi:hypothetical protein